MSGYRYSSIPEAFVLLFQILYNLEKKMSDIQTSLDALTAEETQVSQGLSDVASALQTEGTRVSGDLQLLRSQIAAGQVDPTVLANTAASIDKHTQFMSSVVSTLTSLKSQADAIDQAPAADPAPVSDPAPTSDPVPVADPAPTTDVPAPTTTDQDSTTAAQTPTTDGTASAS